MSIRRVAIVSRNKFNDQTATTQVDLTIRIVKFTKSHYHNNHFLSGVKHGGTFLKDSPISAANRFTVTLVVKLND